MAKEKDITSRPKFFARKKAVTDDMLCERCKHHQFVVLVTYGCDAIMHSNTKLLNGYEAAEIAREGQFIHMWCLEADVVPDCLQYFKEVRAMR